jgi:hypothetical protein
MNSINGLLLKAMLLVVSAFLAIACSDTKKNNEDLNSEAQKDVPASTVGLTEEEKSEGWELLFDGENISKWKGMKTETFPADGWIIEDGMLVVSGKKGGDDVITREKYSNFELVFDFMLTDSANSGIKYFVGEMKNKDKDGSTIFNGPEYQIIDDYNHPAVTDDKKGNLISTGALYLLYSPENKKLKSAGEWNTGKIVAQDNQVEHWLNGVKILSYERGTEDYRSRVAETKFKNQEKYGELESGYIMLTDHTDKVFFKNIKIRRL